MKNAVNAGRGRKFHSCADEKLKQKSLCLKKGHAQKWVIYGHQCQRVEI